jgi:hypothetical protein
MFLEMMTNMRRNVIYSMFMFQPASPQNGSWLSASSLWEIAFANYKVDSLFLEEMFDRVAIYSFKLVYILILKIKMIENKNLGLGKGCAVFLVSDRA